MKKILFLTLLIIIILIGGFLGLQKIFKKSFTQLVEEKEKKFMSKNLNGKKIAIIIAFKDFRDEEYFIPKNIFESAGARIQTISTESGTAIGSQGGEAKIDILIENLKVSDFDAIVFVGGPGAPEYLDNEISYQIVKDTVSQNKILGAICIASTILAKASVLSGRKATVWSSVLDKSAVKTLEENGVIYQDNPVVVDGNIVTGNGPDAAKEFAEKIIEVLTNK